MRRRSKENSKIRRPTGTDHCQRCPRGDRVSAYDEAQEHSTPIERLAELARIPTL
ncbi:MAG: hypothetical protein R3C24_02590 [Cyanobacteriota/Melainabacteria group bacterium]